MYCEKLNLKDFRHYRHAELHLAPGLNIFQGENAAGKTTLLEAVYFLATTKSPRAGSDQEVVSFEAEAEFGVSAFARLQTRVKRNEDHVDAEVIILRDSPENAARKRIKVNGAARRAIDLIGKINVVLFSPEDLDLVIGSPSLRRRYLDMTLSQIDHRYLRNWQEYSKIVAQRNSLLRALRERRGNGRGRGDPDFGRDELAVWNAELVRSGAYLIKRRGEALTSLNERAAGLHAHLTGLAGSLLSDPSGGFKLQYEPSLTLPEANDEAAIATAFAEGLETVRKQELDRGVSLLGPHRDDFSFTIQEMNLSVFGSRGQQRTAVLALKLAEVGWMEAQTGEKPILLLDDILSELDISRRQYVLDTVQKRADQIFITTTDLGLFGEHANLNDIARLYTVGGGEIKRL
jgi:DNA replication and repair protein RecF